MRHRPWVTDMGWGLAKTAVLLAVFLTLAGFTVLSHHFSHSRAGRIACIANQRAMQEAVSYYQTETGGNLPETMEALRPFYSGPPGDFGTCPASAQITYSYNAGSGGFQCPSPEHKAGI